MRDKRYIKKLKILFYAFYEQFSVLAGNHLKKATPQKGEKILSNVDPLSQ